MQINTFGFRQAHNSSLLQSVAHASCGTYYFVDTLDSIPQTFGDALGSLLSVCAQDVEIRIQRAHPHATIHEVHSPFPQRVEGNDVIISVPDLVHEEHKVRRRRCSVRRACML